MTTSTLYSRFIFLYLHFILLFCESSLSFAPSLNVAKCTNSLMRSCIKNSECLFFSYLKMCPYWFLQNTLKFRCQNDSISIEFADSWTMNINIEFYKMIAQNKSPKNNVDKLIGCQHQQNYYIWMIIEKSDGINMSKTCGWHFHNSELYSIKWSSEANEIEKEKKPRNVEARKRSICLWFKFLSNVPKLLKEQKINSEKKNQSQFHFM